MAKTHRISYAFHPGDARAATASEIGAQYDDPLRFAAPEWTLASGAFGEIFLVQPARYPAIERAFRDVRAGLIHPPLDDVALEGAARRALAEYAEQGDRG